MKSLIVFISFLLFPNFIIAQSTDTFYIPEGYTHFILGNPKACFDDLGIVHDTCISQGSIAKFAPGEPDANIFGLGNNQYNCFYDNGETKDSCNYSVNILTGNTDNTIPRFEITSKEVFEEEIFEVEVSVKNFKNINQMYLNVGWDKEYLEIVDTEFLRSSFDSRLYSIGFSKGETLAGYYIDTSDPKLSNSLPDNSVLLRFIFIAKKKGQAGIRFFTGYKNYFGSTSISTSNGIDKLKSNVFLKNGLITIKERTNCFTGINYLKDSFCPDTNYSFGDTTYTNGGFYSKNFKTANGCDSTVLLRLYRYSTGLSYPVNGTICTPSDDYPISGIYRDTFMRVGGCQSIIQTDVTVLSADSCQISPEFIVEDKVISVGDYFCLDVTTKNFLDITTKDLVFEWDREFLGYENVKFYDIDIYEDRLPKVSFLNNNNLVVEWHSKDLRNGSSVKDNTTLFSLCFNAKKAGEVPISFFTQLGERPVYSPRIEKKDVRLLLDVTYKNGLVRIEDKVNCNVEETILSTSICEGNTYIINNQAYNQTGNYQATFTTSNGCDSIVNLQLSILPNITTEITAEIAEGENYILNNQAYNQTDNYQATFIATNGCDSIVDLQLTVLPKSVIETTLRRTICEGTNFEGYTQTGTYLDTFQVANGEDSIRTLELTVAPFISLTCPENDTFTIPVGFTHIAITESLFTTFIGGTNSPMIDPNVCFGELETKETGVPHYKNVFGIGSANAVHSIKNQAIEEECTRTIHIKEGQTVEQLPSFSMGDISVEEGVTFCVDVTTTNFQKIVGFTLFANWDSTALEYIETKFPAIYDNNPPLPGFKSPNVAIVSWLGRDLINGHSFPDSTVTYSLCFKAKRVGQFPINFFTPADLDLSINEIVLNSGVASNICLKSGNIAITESIDCNTTTTSEMGTICAGENYILNNQAYNQTGNYETTFTTASGCDSIVQLALEVLPVPTAIADTFSTKENQTLTFDITSNDVLPAGVNWQTSIIAPPHVGTLTSIGNGQFSYEPRFAYTGPTAFEYQICNEVCLPEGCTTSKVVLNIQGAQIGIDINPTPLPTTITSETSKIQLPLEEGELVVFNIYGQVIEKRFFFKSAQKQLWNLQQHELSAGIYFYVKRAKGINKILESGKIIAVGR